jgi:hypothetical protein
MMRNKEIDMTYEEKYWRYLLRTDASAARIADALAAIPKAEKSAS